MGWFDSKGPKPATPQDATVLRDSLVHMLQQLERRAEQPDSQGVQDLVKRLGRFPSPTGLKKELSRILPSLVDTTDLGGPFAEAAQAMGETMSVLAFPDPAIEEPLQTFQSQLPPAVDLPRAKKLRRDARRLAQRIEPVRVRMLAARQQTRELLIQLAGRLSDESGTAGRVDSTLGELERALCDNDAASLEQLRPELISRVAQAREGTQSLRAGLAQAAADVQTLQRTVDAQAEALRTARRELSQDPLTQVANRRALDKELPRLLAEARAMDTNLGFLALDIDHFKLVNDTYGHAAGDVVLHAIAQKAASLLRAGDLMVRAGGEEFVALLPGSSQRASMAVAERIREGVEAMKFTQDGRPCQVTISIGVATLDASEDAKGLWARADAALYDAKHAGRNQATAA